MCLVIFLDRSKYRVIDSLCLVVGSSSNCQKNVRSHIHTVILKSVQDLAYERRVERDVWCVRFRSTTE